jgi:hypothetical protein
MHDNANRAPMNLEFEMKCRHKIRCILLDFSKDLILSDINGKSTMGEVMTFIEKWEDEKYRNNDDNL